MKANDLIKKYKMDYHVENGLFVERHYLSDKTGRADSGSIYYYIAPGEITQFHRIDCDEYWCHNAGSDIEIWSFTPEGFLRKYILGTSENAEPLVFFRKGEIFASRLPEESPDGSFITCITVPRFSYDGFELIEKEKMLEMFPESSDFWKLDCSV
ncbi:MAG: cupin domain-containing protein [Eubacteriales bacterium]|nr:cupin domain-containing protein [Eubacteriales bacterium]